jgi:DNA recombination protein RmuC
VSELALVVLALIALAVGVGLGWWLASRAAAARMAEQESRVRAEGEAAVAVVRTELAEARGQVAQLQKDRDALAGAQSTSKTLEERLEPVREALEGLRKQSREAEMERGKSDAVLREQISGVQKNYLSLETATRQLVSAMTSSQSRGQWGEMQLERLLEYAGLIEGVHFRTQATQSGDDVPGGRPDVIIHLPGGGEILIDAKFPFDAYWLGVQAEDAGMSGAEHFDKHAKDVLTRANNLAKKKYSATDASADYVVMFMPFESLLSSALEADPDLLHKTFSRNVSIATPTSLLPMLRTVVFGYERKLMAENAEEIRRAGAEMLKRLLVAADHIGGLRKGLVTAVKGYNDFIGSFDGRVIVQARKMQEMGVAADLAIAAPEELLVDMRESKAIEE